MAEHARTGLDRIAFFRWNEIRCLLPSLLLQKRRSRPRLKVMANLLEDFRAFLAARWAPVSERSVGTYVAGRMLLARCHCRKCLGRPRYRSKLQELVQGTLAQLTRGRTQPYVSSRLPRTPNHCLPCHKLGSPGRLPELFTCLKSVAHRRTPQQTTQRPSAAGKTCTNMNSHASQNAIKIHTSKVQVLLPVPTTGRTLLPRACPGLRIVDERVRELMARRLCSPGARAD